MSTEHVKRFRYEGGDLTYEPPESAPADWDGDLSDLIGEYVRAEDLEDPVKVATVLRAHLAKPFETSDGSDDPNRAALISALDLFLNEAANDPA